MKIAPSADRPPKAGNLSPITNLNNEQLQQSEYMSDDPETENQQTISVQYSESKPPLHIMSLSVLDKESEDVEHVGDRKIRWGTGRKQAENGGQEDGDQESQHQMNIKNQIESQKGKQQQKVKAKRKYYKNQSEEFNTIQKSINSENPLVQSSTTSIHTSNHRRKPTKLPSLPKISKKQSFNSTASSKVYDSRRKQPIPDEEQPCFEVSTQRIVTFLLIYQIVLTYYLTVSFLEEKFLILLCALVLVFPSYFGIRCISVVTRDMPKPQDQLYGAEKAKIAKKQCTKIHNSFYNDIREQRTQKSDKGNKKGFNIIGAQNSSPIHPQLQQQSRLSFLSNPSPMSSAARKHLLIVPYLHHNQVQHCIKCPRCPSSHLNTRIKHCHRCETCHYGYDHYCLWLAVCVDGRNYGYFLAFVGLLWGIGVGLVMQGVFFGWRWSGLGLDKSKYFLLGLWGFSAVQTILGLAFLTYVLVYHIWLTRKGISTRQHFSKTTKNPNNPLFLKSICHRLPAQYPSYFLHRLPIEGADTELLLQEPSIKTLEEEQQSDMN